MELKQSGSFIARTLSYEVRSIIATSWPASIGYFIASELGNALQSCSKVLAGSGLAVLTSDSDSARCVRLTS